MKHQIKKIEEWEVETPSGWSNFSAIKKLNKESYFILKFTEGKELKASANHKIKLLHRGFLYLQEIEVGDILVTGEVVESKTLVNENIDLYDLLGVELKSEYFTNGIVSHNCAFIDNIDETFAAAQQTLACIEHNSLVLTDSGLVRIGEIANNAPEGFSDKNTNIVNLHGNIEISDTFYVSPKSDLYKIKFKSGNEIVTTKEHPLFTDRGWVNCENLIIGKDSVKSIYDTQLFGDKIDYTPFIESINKRTINRNLSNGDAAYLAGLWIAEGNYNKDGIEITNIDEQIVTFLKELGFNKYDDRHSKISSQYYRKLLEFIGCEGISKTKKVPSKILSASKLEQVKFLNGLFDGDGCATDRGNIKYTSDSSRLVLDLYSMLLNFGIRSNIEYIDTDEYVLQIDEQDLPLLSENNLDKIENKPSTFYDEIVSITKDKNDISYDFKVSGTHSFLANGLVNHNTGGQCMALSCVVEDTFLVTGKGIQQVRDFVTPNLPIGFSQIAPYNILGQGALRESNLIYNNGVVNTKKISTRYSKLEASTNHKLYASTSNGYGWYRADELKVGDHLAIAGGHRIWGNDNYIGFKQSTINQRKQLDFNTEELTPNLAYLIGLYLAEGSSNGKNYIDITCGDSEDIDIIFAKLNLIYSKQQHSTVHKRICSTNLVDLFKHIGVDLSNTARHKVIPKRLLSASEDVLVALLQGLFDGDGNVTIRGSMGYTSISEELVLQIRAILLNLGIYARLQVRTAKDANEYIERKVQEGHQWAINWNKHNYDAYILEMYGEDIKIFKELVGFGIKRKQDKLVEYLTHRETLKRINIKRVIPNSLHLVQELWKLSKLSQNKFIKETGVQLSNVLNQTTPRFTNHISTKNFNKIYSKWKHLLTEETIKYWDDITIQENRWIPIYSIEDGVNNTYDVSLPNNPEDKWCHSVLYNGILGHQTPNGVGNWFHQTWQNAESGENGFIPVRLPWTVHPERDQAWRDEQDRKLGVKNAAQECDTDFLSSGDTVIDVETLAFYEETYVKEPLEKRGVDGNLWIWETADFSRSYMTVVDVSRGDSTDYSGFHVFDIESLVQVAEYKGKLSPKELGNIVVGIATEYNDALLVIENANIGWSTIEQVLERNYQNLYYSSKSTTETVESYMAKFERDTLVPGFTMSMKTRPLVIAKMTEYMRERSVVLQSKRLLGELRVFIWKNQKAQAQSGYNDDLVMPFATALYVRDTAIRMRQQGMDLSRATLASFTSLNQRSTQAVYNVAPIGNNPYLMDTPNGQEDFSWILG